MLQLLSIGDSTIDSLMQIHDAVVNCKLKKDECLFCIDYADKIPVYAFAREVAGNAANNAVGAARLGMKTAIYTIVGRDDDGEAIRKKLAKEKVSTQYVHKDAQTNASTVINFQGERTILVYHAPRTYNLPKLPELEWIYYTSVSKEHRGLNEAIVKYLTAHPKTRLAYNPGTWQLKTKLKGMREVLRHTYALFVNKEEAARIVGPQHDVRHYLLALRKLGPTIVAITDGPAGSYTINGEKLYYAPILDAPVVERTGAGDSFATAFIAALHYGKSIPTAMCWGSTNSASVIGKVGPQAGLLTRTQLIKLHKRHKVCAKSI